MAASISFFSMLYFGKVGIAFDVFAGSDTIWAKIIAYLSAPFQAPLNWSLSVYKWYPSLNFILLDRFDNFLNFRNLLSWNFSKIRERLFSNSMAYV